MVSKEHQTIIELWADNGRMPAGNMGFSALLTEEYILIFLSLSAVVRG
jgi:hypothetical protein